jgi:TRAP-type C4-dicarboxylate transport system permease small subunit
MDNAARPHPVRRALSALYLGCGILAGIFLVLICVLMLTISLSREIGFQVRSGDDITGWLCAAMSALGLANTFKAGDVVRVGLLVERFEGRKRLIAEAVCLVIGCIITGYLAYFSCDLVWDSYRFNERAQGVLPIPMWIPQLGLAVGTVVQFIAFAEELVLTLTGTRPSYARSAPKTVDEVMEAASHGV